jgi:hypothetical protein
MARDFCSWSGGSRASAAQRGGVTGLPAARASRSSSFVVPPLMPRRFSSFWTAEAVPSASSTPARGGARSPAARVSAQQRASWRGTAARRGTRLCPAAARHRWRAAARPGRATALSAGRRGAPPRGAASGRRRRAARERAGVARHKRGALRAGASRPSASLRTLRAPHVTQQARRVWQADRRAWELFVEPIARYVRVCLAARLGRAQLAAAAAATQTAAAGPQQRTALRTLRAWLGAWRVADAIPGSAPLRNRIARCDAAARVRHG